MCLICDNWQLNLEENHDKDILLKILREVAAKHKWHYLLGPMSDQERVWYDQNSPLRKK